MTVMPLSLAKLDTKYVIISIDEKQNKPNMKNKPTVKSQHPFIKRPPQVL